VEHFVVATVTHRTLSAECWDVVIAVATLPQPVVTLQRLAAVDKPFQATSDHDIADSFPDSVDAVSAADRMQTLAVDVMLQLEMTAAAEWVASDVACLADCAAKVETAAAAVMLAATPAATADVQALQ
jgi:hypothetical protein